MNPTRQCCTFFAIVMLSTGAWGQSQPSDFPPTQSYTFSPAQRAEIEARDQLTRTIATNVEADAQGRSDQQWRTRLMSSLFGLSSFHLRDIATQAHTLSQAHDMANAALGSRASSSPSNSKALTDVGDDLVFTPMTPCRFVDTRNSGSLIPKGSPLFTAFNTSLFGSSYGGDSNCKVPGSGEVAIAANITVTVDSGAAGFLGIRPYGAKTRVSLVNWPTGGTTGIANAAIITTALDTNNNYEFEAYAGGNTPNLIVDLFGYFAPTRPTTFDCVHGSSSTQAIPAAILSNVPVSSCSAGYSLVSIYCSVNSAYITSLGTGIDANGVPFCSYVNNSPTASGGVTSNILCCRIP